MDDPNAKILRKDTLSVGIPMYYWDVFEGTGMEL